MIDIVRYQMVSGIFFPLILIAGATNVTGEISALTNRYSDNQDSDISTYALRYIPNLGVEYPTTGDHLFDTEISMNFSFSYLTGSSVINTDEIDLKPYRLWLRYSTPHFESRLGLQKIAFGPARIFRSLMWFDQIDYRDPQSLTNGVYGLRLKYDFQNNANIWLWSLSGNDDLKGWEYINTKKGTWEGGGRVQYPLGKGELALTVHRRYLNDVEPVRSSIQKPNFTENRIALDGIWDAGVGLYFETAVVQMDYHSSFPEWQSFLTVGGDYTFAVGSGLYLLGEQFLIVSGDSPYRGSEKVNISALSFTYPLGFIDQLLYLGLYDWNREINYHFISWQRTYDQWIFHISIFRSSQTDLETASKSMGSFGNRGIQLTIIFNH